MALRADLPNLLAGEIANVTFDFAGRLASGETISTQAVVAALYSGTDASPTSLVTGSASASGSIVTQKLTTVGRTLGAIYELTCTITTSAGQTLLLKGFTAIVPTL